MAIVRESDGDAGADSSTPYTLSLGDVFQGTLDPANDKDWVRVELTAGTIYDISQTDGEDVRLSLLDAEGNRIIDDRAPGNKIIFSPDEGDTYYIRINTRDDEAAGAYEIALAENTIPIGTYDELADYLIDDWWETINLEPHKVDVETGGELTVNITALNKAGQQLARWALEAWTYVTGIEFVLVENDNAFLTFDDEGEGEGYARNEKENGFITSAEVNISADTLPVLGTDMGSWSFFAYIHEIGHSLGLGHLKPDSAGDDFGNGTIFLIDSFQASAMASYEPDINTYINDSRAHPVTPMIADIIAIQNLYGVPEDSNGGDTIYGYRSNVDGYLGEFFKLWTDENSPFIHLEPQDYARLDGYTLVTSGDLDGDGDADLVTGDLDGAFHYFENTGTVNSPRFTKRSGAANPLDDIDLGDNSIPELADLDDDGDLDLIAGDSTTSAYYFENTGTASAPAFTQRTGSANPMDGIVTGNYINVALADLDGDGDLDLITGNNEGDLDYLENTGSATSPDFTKRTGTASPVNGISADLFSDPELADLDGDGDFDLVVWGWYGVINYFENTGSSTAPVFTERTGEDMPLDLTAGAYAPPVLADLDGDGDLDLVAMHNSVELRYLLNDGTAAEPDFILERLGGGPAALTLYDTGGTDTLDLRTDRDDQRIDLRPEGISDVYGLTGNLIIARDTVIENFIAGLGDDLIAGNAVANHLSGRYGDDRLWGRGGDDILEGGAGADRLDGGEGDDELRGNGGDDKLYGGPGADILDGGAGEDYAYYTGSSVGVLVRLHNANAVKFGEAEGDTLTGIEHIVGSNHNDVLAGDGEDNLLDGGAGDDVLYGGPAGGDDRMYGGTGDDRVFGGRGNDTLTGGAGNDVLKGGPGEDTLIVDGNDMDVLYGGPDQDTFRFFPSNLGGGSIRDFTDGEDVIDLTEFTDINSMDDLDIISHGDNVQIEVSGTDYLTIIILSDFDVTDLDNSDFLF